MKFWHYFSCDIPAFLIFAPKFQSILWLRASLQSLISNGGRRGYSPHSINTSHSFNCGLPATSKFAPKMPNIYSTITLVNENFYATSEEQWRKKGSKFPPNQWKIFIFQVVTFREHQYLAKYCLKCGGAIGLINEVIYPLPLNNSGWIWDSRRNVGLNPPELLRFSFLNCDLPTNSVRIACNQAEISPSQTGPLRL